MLIFKFQLVSDQFIIFSFFSHQLFVCSMFGDSAVFQINDIVGVHHRAQAVGDHYHCAVFEEPVEVVHYSAFVDCIQRGCGLVENQQLGILVYGTCNQYPLFLPLAEFNAAVAYFHVVAAWQTAYEIVDACQLCAVGNPVVIDVFVAERDVFRYGSAEYVLSVWKAEIR